MVIEDKINNKAVGAGHVVSLLVELFPKSTDDTGMRRRPTTNNVVIHNGGYLCALFGPGA